MGTQKRDFYFVAAVLAFTFALGGYLSYRNRTPSPQRVEAHTKAWFEAPRSMVQLMTERYGPPNVLRPDTVTWHARGPWKRIVVHGDSPDTFLEQVVTYRVPPEAGASLREFGHGVQFDYDAEELSARSGEEAINLLAINLADQIASGRRDAREARDFYTRTAVLAASGKSSEYMEKLLFGPIRPEPVDDWPRGMDY